MKTRSSSSVVKHRSGRISHLLGLAAVLLLLFSCGSGHNHVGFEYVTSPTFDQFGATLAETEKGREIKSYFQSSLYFRTEYIFENFNITLPKSLTTGKEYSAGEEGVEIWYARGGQVGSIETEKAQGHFTILEMSGDMLRLKLSLEFSGFTAKRAMVDIPDKIKREGVLTARKGYKLY